MLQLSSKYLKRAKAASHRICFCRQVGCFRLTGLIKHKQCLFIQLWLPKGYSVSIWYRISRVSSVGANVEYPIHTCNLYDTKQTENTSAEFNFLLFLAAQLLASVRNASAPKRVQQCQQPPAPGCFSAAKPLLWSREAACTPCERKKHS